MEGLKNVAKAILWFYESVLIPIGKMIINFTTETIPNKAETLWTMIKSLLD